MLKGNRLTKVSASEDASVDQLCDGLFPPPLPFPKYDSGTNFVVN